jgi:hypothetical protein
MTRMEGLVLAMLCCSVLFLALPVHARPGAKWALMFAGFALVLTLWSAPWLH